jgi:hypothetical protein
VALLGPFVVSIIRSEPSNKPVAVDFSELGSFIAKWRYLEAYSRLRFIVLLEPFYRVVTLPTRSF